MYLRYLTSAGYFVPELLTCLTMVILILLESAYGRREKSRSLFNFCTYIGLIVVFATLCSNFGTDGTGIFTGSLVIDPFSTMLKGIMVLGTLGSIYLANQSRDIDDALRAEFSIMAIGVLVGGMLLSSATNMLILYIGVETLSILSYVLAAFRRGDERSSEAGLKYVLYGGISAGIMLFGISHIYGMTGSIHFSEIAAKCSSLNTTELAILLPSFLFFFAGLGYKIACVPFHMWSPDVYEGSPLPVTTFFSIVPKMAGMAAIVRVSMSFFSGDSLLQDSWVGLLVVISALTMTVGSISAIGQKSVKRMLAYSSIGHAGLMLAGVVVLNSVGVRAILFYGFTYLFMTLAAFYIVSFVNDKYGNDDFDRFSGLINRYPIMAIMLTIVMFSLAGLPPLSGFVAKFNILAVIIKEKHYTLALIAGINSVIALYYYLKIVRLMVFAPAESNSPVSGFTYVNQGVIMVLTIPVVMLGIFWSSLMNLVGKASILIQ